MIEIKNIQDNIKVIGILIRSNRISQGYSLRDLGDLTNISHTLISNIEKGKQVPSLDTLKDILKALKLNFYDDEDLRKEFKDKEFEIYGLLYNQDYDQAKQMIAPLLEQESKYLFSLEVVNYILLKHFYCAITNIHNEEDEIRFNHYEKVFDFFSETQKQMFYFIQGLIHLNNERYNKATTQFNFALSLGNKAIDVFIHEYNIISLVRQYKFIDAYKASEIVIKEFENRTIYIRAMKTKLQVARIYYHIAKNNETIELANYVERFARKFQIDELLEECIMLKAAIEIRNRNFDKAITLLDNMPDPTSISSVLLRFKVAFVKEDKEEILSYYKEISNLPHVKSHKKVWYYIQIQAMSKVESLYEEDKYIENIEYLTKLATTNNDQEMIGLSYNYLIMHYHEKRKYKKALELAETLLHFKKIRIENE
jgi:transcriptional regulator with XRE-family HTH domain